MIITYHYLTQFIQFEQSFHVRNSAMVFFQHYFMFFVILAHSGCSPFSEVASLLSLLARLLNKRKINITSTSVVNSHPEYTRKNAQLVTNLQQTCSKLVGTSLLQYLFALLVPSLLTSCYKPAADLLQA